jgi:outer membrane protein OmpA-like peptidoglycan-associated protein
MKRLWKIAPYLLLLTLIACTAADPYQRTKVGAGVGAVTGAVVGHLVDDDAGKYIGAAVGALAGGAVGNYMDRQQQAFEQALAEEQRRHNLEIQRLQDGSIKLDIPSEVSFDFDSAAIKPAFVPSLDKVANIVWEYNQTVVHIIGHTDNIGSENYNMNLSQRRAGSVAEFLAARGISWQRLRTEGRGEWEPRASNATSAGRQLNRRVEMVIKPVIEGQEQSAYRSPGSHADGTYPTSNLPSGGYGGYSQGGVASQDGYGNDPDEKMPKNPYVANPRKPDSAY